MAVGQVERRRWKTLDGRAVEDDGDTCQVRGASIWSTLPVGGLVVWASKPPWMVFRFGASQNLGLVPVGISGGTWRHHEACVEAKLSHEGRVAVGSVDL
jgi:hypothetical protein